MSIVPEVEPIHVPDDVREFAERHHLTHLLPKVMKAARRVFPEFRLSLSVYEDPEVEGMDGILLTVHELRLTPEQSLQASDDWHAALLDAVTGHHAFYFRLYLDLL